MANSENLPIFTGSTLSLANSVVVSTTTSISTLPWGAQRETLIGGSASGPASSLGSSIINLDVNVKPGQYVLQSLFADFTILTEKKFQKILAEPLERQLAKSLQQGEDLLFDQLLSSFSAVAEHCLPSLLKTLFEWYKLQNGESKSFESGHQRAASSSSVTKSKGDKDYMIEKHDLAVDFLFCRVLIEVLTKLPVHPVPESLLQNIENSAFKHFRHHEGQQTGPNSENYHIVADLYAEVIGVLSKTRYLSLKKKFISELKELRGEQQNMHTTQSIISLIMGMKFYRVQLSSHEDFEASFKLLHECAGYFLEVKDKDIKHALAGLLVEILVPVAAMVKYEVNIPIVKNFVDRLYPYTYEHCNKKKHILAFFPLVTCLLCVSQREFFLQNWTQFLASCIKHLQGRLSIARTALESLYRLLWVYVIRLNCESNADTHSRLQRIIDSLFPKSSMRDKGVVPKDTPLSIFVKIIQFIAQKRLDFAIRDVIFDLLGVNTFKAGKCVIYPERMNIGLRAFLVIADRLEQRDGEPPMPSTTSVLPSGNTLRIRKAFLNKQLTDETAKDLNIENYLASVLKTLGNILSQLDLQVGKPLMMTNPQCVGKDPEELITNMVKPKIDLFHTCVASIPRLIPDGIGRYELLNLLSRLTIHLDEELRGIATTSLQNIIVELESWREDVLLCFATFILKEIQDTFTTMLDNSLRILHQLLIKWRTAVQASDPRPSRPEYERPHLTTVLNYIEGFALVMLCSSHQIPRRLAVCLLKEIQILFGVFGFSKIYEPVLSVMDKTCPVLLEELMPHMSSSEKMLVISSPNIDLQWLVDRSLSVWSTTNFNSSMGEPAFVEEPQGVEAWTYCMAWFLKVDVLPQHCSAAVSQSWLAVYLRLNQVFSHIDPNCQNDGSKTNYRGGKKILNNEHAFMSLWRNYLVFACCCVPSSGKFLQSGSASLETSGSSSSELTSSVEKVDIKTFPFKLVSGATATNLFKMLVPLIRCESNEVRESVITGLGWTSHHGVRDLLEELTPAIKEAIDRKQENMRRKKKKNSLRCNLICIFELLAEHSVFGNCYVKDLQSINPLLVEYVEGTKLFLDAENERELVAVLQDIRLHFSGFIYKLVRSISLENRPSFLKLDMRYSIFFLCSNWCPKFGVIHGNDMTRDEPISDLEWSAMQAMCAVLVCGPIFDSNAITHEAYIYNWLDSLLNSQDEKVNKLGIETAIFLLENNKTEPSVLLWAINRCYTGSHRVSRGCFTTLTSVLTTREYPCDMVSTLCVTVLMIADTDKAISESALQLLLLLDARFLAPISSSCQRLSATYGKSHIYLCEELTRLHPEITLAVFSEFTERFETAPPETRKIILECLLPWVHNVELMESGTFASPSKLIVTNNVSKNCEKEAENFRGGHLDEGWGSPLATDLVLNNLFYITVEYGDDHGLELERLWTSLFECWPGNVKIVLHFLMMLAGLITSQELLPYVKRVLSYIVRAKTPQLMEELVHELLSVEPVNHSVERCEEPPYFRLFYLQQEFLEEAHDDIESVISLDTTEENVTLVAQHDSNKASLAKGAQYEPGSQVPSLRKDNNVLLPPGGEGGQAAGIPDEQQSSELADSCRSSLTEEDIVIVHFGAGGSGGGGASGGGAGSKPRTVYSQWWDERDVKEGISSPLPLPESGAYFAPLVDYMCDNSESSIGGIQNSIVYRCNLAVILLSDLVSDRIDVDWSIRLPHMLHAVILGLDHSSPLVHEHCKKLLVNLLVMFSSQSDNADIAKVLLSNNIVSSSWLSGPSPTSKELEYSFEEFLPEMELNEDGSGDPKFTGSTTTIGGASTTSTASSAQTVLSTTTTTITIPKVPLDGETLSTINENILKFIKYLITRKPRPLWFCEDITSKEFSIKSAEQIAVFVRQLVRLFGESSFHARLEHRWAQVALQLALSSSCRHYAGRSFQIFRALEVPLTESSRWLSDILNRLVETVAEPGEDTQGYVTEIMLTLESAVDILAPDPCISELRDLAAPLPKFILENQKESFRKSTGDILSFRSSGVMTNKRSFSISNCLSSHTSASLLTADSSEHRSRSATVGEKKIPRSKSMQSIKHLSEQQDDRLSLMIQIFWIAISLLESDYEYEFMLAIRLLNKLLTHINLERTECRAKVEKVFRELNWDNYPGIQALLLKGLTSSMTNEATLNLIGRLTLLTSLPVIDPYPWKGLPTNIIALLPFLTLHFDNPNDQSIEYAENIAQVCLESHSKLTPLAKLMEVYCRRTYNKDHLSWMDAVCRYITGAYPQLCISMLTFLVEVLEKGPSSSQQASLQMAECLIQHVDLLSAPLSQVNGELLRSITKYVQSNYWKEALRILKLAVERSSALASPSTSNEKDTNTLATRFATGEMQKKELPGRTLEFTFDLSKTPMFGRKYPLSSSLLTMSPALSDESARSTTSSSDTADTDSVTFDSYDVTRSVSSYSAASVANLPPVVGEAPVGLSQQSATTLGLPCWKVPQKSQRRTRERLVALLNGLGQNVGLPRSPSVIFSSTSSIPGATGMERQTSKASNSGSESASLSKPDGSSLNESNPTELRVFDFLENEMEPQEEKAWGWTMSRQSLESLEDEHSHKGGGEAGPSLGVAEGKDESSDDESRSMSSIDEILQSSSEVPEGASNNLYGATASSSNEFFAALTPVPLNSSPPDSLSSMDSDMEGNGSRSSLLAPGINVSHFIYIPMDEIENEWKKHVSNIMNDSNGAEAINTYYIFSQLYEITRHHFYNLTREACNYLDEKLKGIALQFLNMLEVIMSQAECPFVYTDTQTLLNCRILERHKFFVLEIQHHFETYTIMCEGTEQYLLNVKDTLKLQTTGEQVEQGNVYNQQMQICRSLYKLHFQFLMLFDSYSKLINLLGIAAKSDKIFDFSKDVTRAREELKTILSDLKSGKKSSFPADEVFSADCKQEEVPDILSGYLSSKEYAKAICFLKFMRTTRTDLEFGRDEEDLNLLLHIYSQYLTKEKNGILVVTQPERDLSEVCNTLMSVNIELDSSLKKMEKMGEVVVHLPSNNSDILSSTL